jgi:hypothetical protein
VVDGTPISLNAWQADVENAQRLAPAGTTLASIRAQLYRNRVEAIAALHEAQREGLTVSDSELDAFVANLQTDYAAMPDSASVIEIEASQRGVSPDQFWTAIRPELSQMLLVLKLRAHYVAGLGAVTHDQAAQQWDAYRVGLASRATVQVTDATAVTGSDQ